MCKCTPEKRTPFCGAPGCEWPEQPESEQLISEDWLRAVGFKWHQLEGQPGKHWLLWLGRPGEIESIGLEIAARAYVREDPPGWFCWLRSDVARRYGRFIHVRTVRTRLDVIRLVEAITGQPWNPDNHLYGYVMTPEQAAREREREERLDRKWMRENVKAGFHWREIEKDDTMGGALPDHLEAHEKAKPNAR